MSLPPRKPFGWVAGHIALDFVNTRAWFVDAPKSERFRTASDVLEWGEQSGVLMSSQAAVLSAAMSHAGRAQALVSEAHTLRSLLHRVLQSTALGRPVDPVVLESFNERLAAASAAMSLVQLKVVGEAPPFRRRWHVEDYHASNLFSPLLVSAADLLVGDEVRRLRSCGNDLCGWVFLDTSRNGQRRWCDMRVCGNRVKSRRRYARDRQVRDGLA